MSKPLRILHICHKPPRPAVDGGCIAMDSLTTDCSKKTHPQGVDASHPQAPLCGVCPFRGLLAQTQFRVFADTELNVRDAMSHVVTGESYHLSRFHVPEMEMAIDALRTDLYDVVLLESLFTTSYIPAIRRLSDAEIVLRAHNVEHQLWEEVSKGMERGPKKWLLHLFQGKLKNEEIQSLQSVDAIAAINT